MKTKLIVAREIGERTDSEGTTFKKVKREELTKDLNLGSINKPRNKDIVRISYETEKGEEVKE